MQLELNPRPYWLLGTRWDPYDPKTESTWRFLWFPTIGVSSEAGSKLGTDQEPEPVHDPILGDRRDWLKGRVAGVGDVL